MPYNSSAFEKQLAKYKAAQAGKKMADTPIDDRHRAQSRVAGVRGQLKPSLKAQALDPDPRGPVLRADQIEDTAQIQPIIVKGKKRFYRRGWFVFLAFSVLSTAAMPVFFKDEMAQVVDMAESVKTSTGVDPFAMKTYTNMLKGQPVASNPPSAPPTTSPMAVPPDPTASMGDIVQQAQERAKAVVSQGADQSMQYIQSETERLNKMARELDAQSGINSQK